MNITKLIPLETQELQDSIGKYMRLAETEEFVYFINPDEGDENGAFKMYRKCADCLELVSDNYFASVGFFEDLDEQSFTMFSKKLLEAMGDHEDIYPELIELAN